MTIYVFLRGEEDYKLSRTEILSSSNLAQCKMKYANATQHCFGSICPEHDPAALSLDDIQNSSCVPAYSDQV